MNNLKYRIWDKKQKKMYYYDTLSAEKWLIDMNGNLGCLNIVDMSWSGLIPKGYYEILPYIGLEDKNGNKIYVGDIIQFIKENGYIGKDYVMFEEGRYTTGLGYNISYYIRSSEGVEVIGNIFENFEHEKDIDYPIYDTLKDEYWL